MSLLVLYYAVCRILDCRFVTLLPELLVNYSYHLNRNGNVDRLLTKINDVYKLPFKTTCYFPNSDLPACISFIFNILKVDR